MLLNGRVAVVTGGSRGIGSGIALEFARQGAAVIVNYNNRPDAAEEVVEQINAVGGTGLAIQADIANLEQAQSLIQAAIDQFEKIDILVNNAGLTRDNLIMMMKEEDWDTVIDINLKGSWNCSKAVAEAMMSQQYGRIINITSISGIAGQGGQTNYSSSKAAMIGLTKSLARELAVHNITVNAIAPGFIHTDLTSQLADDLMAQIDAAIPLGRWGTVEDVAHTVTFIASDLAAYITGQVLCVDGGLVMG